MRFRTFSLGMRHQLWGLFGLLLLAGVTVLVIDEMLQSYTRTSLEQMRDNSLHRLRALKAVSDGYGLDVVDTTFRVRNGLMTWDKGVATIDAAQEKIDRSWDALQTMPRSPEQQVLFEQVRGARVRSRAAGDGERQLARMPGAGAGTGACRRPSRPRRSRAIRLPSPDSRRTGSDW